MLPEVEAIQPGPGASFILRSFETPYFAFHWHLHREYELTLIPRGQGRRLVGDSIEHFTSGDLVLLGSYLPHTWHSQPATGRTPGKSLSRSSDKSSKRCSAIVIQFAPDCWGRDFFQTPELASVSRLLARSATGLQFQGQVRKRVATAMMRMIDLAPPSRMIALLEILTELARSRQARKLATSAQNIPLRVHDQKRIDRVLRHLNQHYTRPIQQPALARMIHLSPSAFSRFFKRMTGKAFVDFLQDLRLSHATRMLIETDEPISDICHASGFGNLSNFNRRFHLKHRCTPREYRRQLLGT